MKRVRHNFLTAIFAIICVIALVGIVVPRVMGRSGSGVAITQSGLASLESATMLFKLDCGRYPTDQEGLAALITSPAKLERKWKGPYLDHAVPHDEWGRDFIYKNTSQKGVPSYIIESYGSDGKQGGTGDNADIIGGSD
jgi:general secretion pathway protein G